jgi:hypothetical protein
MIVGVSWLPMLDTLRREPQKVPRSGLGTSKSTPWCARDTSPGSGTWPPPISPTAELVWCGARTGPVMTTAVRPDSLKVT